MCNYSVQTLNRANARLEREPGQTSKITKYEEPAGPKLRRLDISARGGGGRDHNFKGTPRTTTLKGRRGGEPESWRRKRKR